MAEPVCGGTEQTRSSHIRMALCQRLPTLKSRGGYEQSPFLYEPERKVEIPLGEESR